MSNELPRRDFIRTAVGGTAAMALASAAQAPQAAAQEQPAKKIRVGVIGCGSVSGSYLPHLSQCPYAELVSTCDIIPERAERRAREFNVGRHYPHIDKMLAGEPFDLLINLTDMQEHEHLNREAIAAGKHVWSEKPIANTWAAGQELLAASREKGLRLWGAPIVVTSDHFAFMDAQLKQGKLGRVAAAHAEYGHTGPTWSSFFYEKGGGSMPDLGVYNITSLTGLLGPAKSVTAMVSIVTPTRQIDRKGEIKVTEEDNAQVLLDHGNGVISHICSGFNYYNPHGHDGSQEKRHTLWVVGSKGYLGLVGYDWEPLGVDIATEDRPQVERVLTEKTWYVWQAGGSLACETLATGKELLVRPEHALHVVDIMVAARKSQETGKRIDLASTFPWPVIG